MSQTAKFLMKDPPLDPALDFYRLRREAVGFIEQMGSRWWTDYNLHDPGITILENLCHAITDLAYRLGWRIEDILSPEISPADPLRPYPDQAFFTAREILTVNPTTPDDFRRLLIDLAKVRNAWVFCKDCACEASYFAFCDKDALVLSYEPPAGIIPAPVEVWARGLYEALIELEDDPELGDLNDRKIEAQAVFHDAAGPHATILELRFPDISLTGGGPWRLFLESDAAFADESSFDVTLTRLGATRTFDVFKDLATDADRDAYIRNHWRTLFYASFEIRIVSSGEKIAIEDASLRLLGDAAAKSNATANGLRDILLDKRPSGFVRRYRRKALAAIAAVESAKAALRSHRNLDEDYCLVRGVGVEEVAVCADVEVRPDADIERVQAQLWFEIERYFNPPIRFHTLQELRDSGKPVEDIFDGPALGSGFIEPGDLKDASLRGVLRVSDILNRLMDIDGIIAVNRLSLTRYDAEGNAVAGVADPTWVDGKPVFNPSKLGASWLLFISGRHQPRLYRNMSRFLFSKNGLPFQPRADEALDTLNQLRGDADRPRNHDAEDDLRIPKGKFRNPGDYEPVQYGFPLAYGIGPGGLPPDASPARRARAKQLKAYLMIFEQLLGDALTQLAHTADLFSLDPAVRRTDFVKMFSDAQIKGFADIAEPGMTQAAIESLAESQAEFLDRRNHFLDHLLARFGEDFREHVLMLADAAGRRVARSRLIENKIAFLRRYPQISHDRGKAFDSTNEPCSDRNNPGIKKRITLLLGHPDLAFEWSVGTQVAGQYPLDFQLADPGGGWTLEGGVTVGAAGEAKAKQAGDWAVIGQMIQADAWEVAGEAGKFRLKLKDKDADDLGQHPQLLDTTADAEAMRDRLMAWAASERLIVVEHLLLRPKFPGDALYPACCDGGCHTCGEEDPYSFRLTFVMPGWGPLSSDHLDLRRFAERTIRQETPAHLLGKTCWVGNDGFIESPCDEAIGDLADLLAARGKAAGGSSPTGEDACDCAIAIFHGFSTVFRSWYEGKALAFIHADALAVLIGAEFAVRVDPAGIACAALLDPAIWAEIQTLMTDRFVGVALHGRQFDRFEDAWRRWLEANAAIDWTEERLLARVRAILQINLLTADVKEEALCDCAKGILTRYGMTFHGWMRDNLEAGNPLEVFTAFNAPTVALCPGMNFRAGTADAIARLLDDRYAAYREVSYRLSVVVDLLGKLRNTYPGATLHDCDDGGDRNPVRLDNTALGH